jgi:arylsulfatase A-like enzyme
LQISAPAIILLSIGVTVQTHFWLRNRKGGAINYLAHKALPLLGLVILLAVGVYSAKKGYTYFLVSNLPPAKENSPNVILITLDTVRADHLSNYGYNRSTPNIAQFAKEGIQFDYALSSSPWTLPSHATIMTGLFTYEHQADGFTSGKLDNKFYTLAEAFADNGYQTAGFVANFLYCTASMGFAQGFSEFHDVLWNYEDIFRLTRVGFYLNEYIRLQESFHWHYMGRKTAQEINREFMAWAPTRKDHPFFVWLNYFDAHDPYYTPEPYQQKYGSDLASGNPKSFGLSGSSLYSHQLSAEEEKEQFDAYDTTIYYMDNQLGELFEFLKEQGLYDNTIIILTSDHGEAFGEHNFYGHGNSLYRELLHVPLIIRYPELIQKGERSNQVVSLQRLAATIQDLANIQKKPYFPGTSLLTDKSSTDFALAELGYNPVFPSVYPNSKAKLISLTTRDWHVIFTGNQGEVFSFQDFLDGSDLSGTPEGAAILGKFKLILDDLQQ